MYKEFYQLHVEPFRLTPDARFVYHHASYSKALGYMQYAMQQGDGILVITGRSGTGKTTLADFLVKQRPGGGFVTSLASSDFERDDLLRMVGYAFCLDVQDLDKATLLHELEVFLRRQTRALLIIDEAQNLSSAALEELRMLTDMRVGSRPLLQIFLLGQEHLHERLHTAEMEQFHQRLVAACVLEPLRLQETHDYVMHRLVCAGWRGNPAISNDTFILIHRFSQGLPRYINKVFTRLLLQGAVEQRRRLDLDDVVTVIEEIRKELLLPLPAGAGDCSSEVLPPIEDLVQTRALPVDLRIALTEEEQAFIRDNPALTCAPPAPEPAARQHTSPDTSATASAPARPQERIPKPAPTGRTWGRAIEITPHLKRLGTICHDFGRKSRRGLILVVRQLRQAECAPHFRNRLTATFRGRRQSRFAAYVAVVLMVFVGTTLLFTHDPGYPGDSAPLADTAEQPIFDSAIHQFPVPASGHLVPASYSLQYAVHKPPQHRQDLLVTAPEKARPIAPQPEIESGSPVGNEESQEVVTIVEFSATEPVATLQKSRADIAVEVVAEPARDDREDKIENLLLLAEQAIAQDYLCIPEEKSAWHHYKQVLEIDPDNQAAGSGLQRIAARYAEFAVKVMEKNQYEKAHLYIRRGLDVVAQDDELMALQLEANAKQAEFLLKQERELRLAREAAEASSQQTANQPAPTRGGFIGTLRRFFGGGKARSPSQ